MTLRVMLLVLAATAGSDSAPEALSHASEVKLFASTMATVKVVSGACPDMHANSAYLADLRDRLHLTDADKPAFADESRTVAMALSEGLAEAPSQNAWCAAAYRLYGVGGSLLPGLFGR